MDVQSNPYGRSGEQPDAKADNGGAQSLTQLLEGVRELCGQTVEHARGIGELAFLELDQTISTLQWWLGTLVLFAVCSIMAAAFVIAATVVAFTESTFSPGATILLMAALCALAACVLFLCLRGLAKKMTFSTLRSQLTRPQDKQHVEPCS
jgi:hypothetical protein